MKPCSLNMTTSENDRCDEGQKNELTLPVCVILFSRWTASMVSTVGAGAPKANKINPSVAKTVQAARKNIMMVRLDTQEYRRYKVRRRKTMEQYSEVRNQGGGTLTLEGVGGPKTSGREGAFIYPRNGDTVICLEVPGPKSPGPSSVARC